MNRLIKLDQFNAHYEYATILAERYYRKYGDYPIGYGKWIFTNPECQPFEIVDYYTNAQSAAKIHFKKLGYRFCYVSPKSIKLKSPNRKPKWKKTKTN